MGALYTHYDDQRLKVPRFLEAVYYLATPSSDTLPLAANKMLMNLKLRTNIADADPYFHPILSAWISENSFNVKKRALTAATYNVIVQIGSLIGSQIYRADDAPYYYRGNKVLISICALSLVVMLGQRWWLMLLNKRKEKVWGRMDEEERLIYQEQIAEREKDGNKRLEFRFRF